MGRVEPLALPAERTASPELTGYVGSGRFENVSTLISAGFAALEGRPSGATMHVLRKTYINLWWSSQGLPDRSEGRQSGIVSHTGIAPRFSI